MIDFDTHTADADKPWTHSVADESLRYFTHAPDASAQEIADAFLKDYYVDEEHDDGEAIEFSVDDMKGVSLGMFKGRPGHPARRVA